MEDISNGFNHLTASSSRLSENFSLNSQKKLEFSFLTNSADATATKVVYYKVSLSQRRHFLQRPMTSYAGRFSTKLDLGY